ncbi:serine/threonine protein kinase [Enterobacterales bacterium CwR94]|nr:serine/threonine protein kinase [Enterobacterales bacterium CwR94]
MSDKPVTDALPAGYRFNEFEINEVIGGGGFGIVYRAWDHQLERTIAIKEFLPASLATRGEDQQVVLRGERFQKMFNAGLSSFIQEARLLARFNHPGLLHVLRFWEENGTAYMGTQFYSGMTLKAWQQSRPEVINEAWIRELLPPLFGAISTLHRAGYLHRDISLDNIQIQDNQLPVLLDFGSARKEIGNLSDETEIMLKPGYAPIEQYSEEGDSNQGPWTDVYALGAVLHTLVTGSPPTASVVRCIEDSYQPLTERRPEGFSLPLLNAIDRALAMKPDARPQSIDAFAALLALPVSEVEEWVRSTALVAPTVEPEEPAIVVEESVMLAVNHAAGTAEQVAPRSQRRLSRPLVVMSSLALVAVIALTTWLNRDDASPEQVSPQPQSAVSHTPTPAAPTTTAAKPVSSDPVVATVYLKLQAGEVLKLNGEVMDVKPNNSGYASLNLAAGEYRVEVQRGSEIHAHQLNVDKPGTWLINPGS